MTDPIRAELEALIAAHDEHGGNWLPCHEEAWHNALKRARAALATPTPEPDTDAVLKLAAVIRQVDGSHSLGAAALAEAILAHPAAQEVFTASTPPAGGEAEELAQWLEKLITHPVDIRTRIDRFFIDQIRRAATMLRQLPPEGLETVRYSVADDDVTIQRTNKAPDSWAIYCGDLSMSVTGDWDLDPKLVSWPSRRTDEWIATHRWPTVAAAWEALQQNRQGEESDD